MTETLADKMAEQPSSKWASRLRQLNTQLPNVPPPPVEGRLTRMIGLTLEAVGCLSAVGDRCKIISSGTEPTYAEVVGFDGDRLYLMPTGNVHGLKPGARVIPLDSGERIPIDDSLLGRVIDGHGKPLDGMPAIRSNDSVSLHGIEVNPMDRAPINTTLDVGVRAINSLFTIGRGQRLGLFASAGMGKSTLLGMMARYTQADVVVVGLIGERGREVREFIDHSLGEEGRARSVVVASPADAPPLMRLHGAMLANSVAEYFRSQGKHVLLLMDSLTRYAQAQRETALATGELPATKGYPPSVFAKLPQLVERAGNGVVGGGSITAFYTVLTEGDADNDPVADSARAILDGHIVLSRNLAEAGHFPAIDPESSISRAMNNIVAKEHQAVAIKFRKAYTTYQHNADLISVGAYQKGTDPAVDQAIVIQPKLLNFLKQGEYERSDLHQSLAQLKALFVGVR